MAPADKRLAIQVEDHMLDYGHFEGIILEQGNNMKRYIEELIEVADDCPVKQATIPRDGSSNKTIARIGYEVLIANPYKFTEREFFKEVHEVRRKRTDLKLESYNIKRAALVKAFGWGIHRNKEGKLALIPMESTEYKYLQDIIRTTKSYRIKA